MKNLDYLLSEKERLEVLYRNEKNPEMKLKIKNILKLTREEIEYYMK